MDKNLQYAVKRGYPVVRIALTLENAKELQAWLQDCPADVVIRNYILGKLTDALAAIEQA